MMSTALEHQRLTKTDEFLMKLYTNFHFQSHNFITNPTAVKHTRRDSDAL